MENKKPMIALTPLVDEARDSYWMLRGYMKGIELAGGIPVMLPLMDDEDSVERMADIFDGFVFTGGPDIAPERYGQAPLPECGETIPGRDALETKLLSAVLGRNKPVLGICRGLQLINTVLGGTLYQDLPSQHPSQISHRMTPPYDREWHEVSLEEGSPLRTLLGRDRIGVNSCHHQAICVPASGLVPMAWSPDGLIEAVYMPEKKFLWAFQWHPEFSYKVNSDSVAIFKTFVASMIE